MSQERGATTASASNKMGNHRKAVYHTPVQIMSHLPTTDIDFNVDGQRYWLSQLAPFIGQCPYVTQQTPAGMRYQNTKQGRYNRTDAAVQYAILSFVQPKHYLEVGSGCSTAVALDAADNMSHTMQITCIDTRLQHLLDAHVPSADHHRIHTYQQPAETVDSAIFTQLTAGDVLFIDSSHTVSPGSDVAYLLFTILPLLPSGVYVHVHDIFTNFVYPEQWHERASRWNEITHVRAFLQYNSRFSIQLFVHYLVTRLPALWNTECPALAHKPGGSLWLRKT